MIGNDAKKKWEGGFKSLFAALFLAHALISSTCPVAGAHPGAVDGNGGHHEGSTTMAKAGSSPSPYGNHTPQDGDIVLTSDDTPEKVMSQIMIAFDSDTGVFSFRHQRRLYMRFVEFG